MIHDSCKNFLPDSWFTKTFDHLFIKWINFLSGYVVSFCIQVSLVSKLVFSTRITSRFWTTVSRYHQSFCPRRYGVFCKWTLSTRVTGETSGRSAPNAFRGMLPGKKNLKIGRSETPYPAFPGSNAINSYVYFVELFSESRYSWFLSRSTKIRDFLQVLTINNDSWFMIPLPPPMYVLTEEIHLEISDALRGVFVHFWTKTYIFKSPFYTMYGIRNSKLLSFHVTNLNFDKCIHARRVNELKR